jgi:membrane-bound lytic murein transglycosylase A
MTRLAGLLAGWSKDDHEAALSAYAETADLLPPDWPRPDGTAARAFFETNFRPLFPPKSGLLTGYYEPELCGSPTRTDRFRFPLHASPPVLRPDQPWFTRAEIEDGDLLCGHELVWLDSPLEAFLAQVQGSLRVRLDGEQILRLGYAGKNGQPYSSIGQELIARGELAADDASVGRIREWAARNPQALPALLRVNRSYVFFRKLDLPPDKGPLGTMGRPLTALRSIAVDPAAVPLGAPVWVEQSGEGWLMIAQDTGGAIRGAGRGDIYFGTGAAAGERAGRMKATGRLTVLGPAGLA